MPKGGKRPGAGRPKGAIDKGTRAIREAIENSGEELPLDYMLRTMRTATDESRRDDMAKAAAPYLHARLAAIEHTGKDGGPIETADVSGMTMEERTQRIARLLAGPTQH